MPATATRAFVMRAGHACYIISFNLTLAIELCHAVCVCLALRVFLLFIDVVARGLAVGVGVARVAVGVVVQGRRCVAVSVVVQGRRGVAVSVVVQGQRRVSVGVGLKPALAVDVGLPLSECLCQRCRDVAMRRQQLRKLFGKRLVFGRRQH